MRIAVSLCWVLAAGFTLPNIQSSAAVAEVPSGDHVRVDREIFHRYASLASTSRGLPFPGADESRIVPLPHAPAPSRAAFAEGRAALPWTSAPALPKALSQPPIASDPFERKLLPVEAAPAPLEERPRLAARVCAFCVGAQLMSRERDGPTMSRLARPKQGVTHPGDPLASFEFAETPPEFIMPFAHGRVTSLFNQGRRHPAIDLAGALGSTVLATSMRQTVIFAAWRGGYGNAVITQDPYGRTHLYGHLQKITAKVGQVLDQGDKLGHLGSTGYSTGPHVHYEVKTSKGAHINPVTLLFAGRGVKQGFAWNDPASVAVPGGAAQVRPRYAAMP